MLLSCIIMYKEILNPNTYSLLQVSALHFYHIQMTIAGVKTTFQRLKVYQVIYDHHFMVNSKISFIMFVQV